MKFADQIIVGLILSGPILLVAVSLSAVLASSRVLNIAIGATYSLAAICAVRLLPDVGTAGFVLICIFFPVVIFLAMDVIVLSPQRARTRDSEMASFAATMGISLIFGGLAAQLSSGSVLALPTNFIQLGRPWTPGGLTIPKEGALAVAAAVIMLIIYWVVLEWSSIGKQFRAVAQDRFLARTIGARVDHIVRLSWIVSGLMTGVATLLLLVTDRSVSASSGGDLLLVPFAAVIAGGMGSPLGAGVASVFFGLSEALITLVTSAGDFQEVLVFGILFAVLIFRPQGLFSGARSTRAY